MVFLSFYGSDSWEAARRKALEEAQAARMQLEAEEASIRSVSEPQIGQAARRKEQEEKAAALQASF